MSSVFRKIVPVQGLFRLGQRGRQTCPETPGPALEDAPRVLSGRERDQVSLLSGNPGRGRPLPSQFELSVCCRSVAAQLVWFVLFVCLVGVLYVVNSIVLPMGQQLTTPLSLTLGHWKEVTKWAHNQSVEVCKKKWLAFCTSEWPSLEVGWLQDGTFNLTIILQVKEKVFQLGPHGHLDQVPYIVTWESLFRDPPTWVKPFLSSLGAQTPKPGPRPSSTPLVPLPLAPLTFSSLLPLNEPPKPMPKTPPVLPDTQENLLLLDPPPPYPPQVPPQLVQEPQDPEPSSPDSTEMGGLEPASSPPSSPAAAEGTCRWPGGCLVLSSISFKVGGRPDSVLAALRLRPIQLEDPQSLLFPRPPSFDRILLTHQPTWDDCQQLLQALLTTEEKQRVILEARKNVLGADGRPTQLPNEIEDVFPLTPPEWDYNTVACRERLRVYRQTLLVGLKGAGKRPTNLAKVRAIIQGQEETPAGFLECLMEGYRMYTPFDPLAAERQLDVIMSFIGQLAPDIQNKLQRLDGLQQYTLQDLLKEADKIFNKRETQEEKEERLRKEQERREDIWDKKRNRELTKILATVVQGAGQGRPGQNKTLGDKRRPRVE
uniref:Uncharacterized protein n=1 Tax=Oryctolagus cuniculus TaxID=9986 RepID=A0A5F9DJT5_RABIT